jgi:hypothetical protein
VHLNPVSVFQSTETILTFGGFTKLCIFIKQVKPQKVKIVSVLRKTDTGFV